MQGLLAEGDRGCLYSVARALTQLQAVTGAVTRVKGKGPSAAALRRLLARMRRELGAAAPPLGVSQAEPCLMLLQCVIRGMIYSKAYWQISLNSRLF